MEEQLINCMVAKKQNGKRGKIPFVYSASGVEERKELWQQLRREETNQPWLVLGDFNAMINEDERRGARSIVEPEMEFRDCVTDLSLNDLRATGCYFTWVNIRSGRDAIAAKLDRALANREWVNLFRYSNFTLQNL